MLSVIVTELPASVMLNRKLKSQRIHSIDLLRGIVMIIMALDHVRAYFHQDAFLYSPTDLAQTSPFLFFTRFITHYCAPVFIFLSGISAYLSGTKKSKRELSRYLFLRGLWMLFTELFIIALAQTLNPSYPMFNLQVIWAIGICMIVLSALIHLPKRLLLLTACLLIAGHNLLDTVHVAGSGPKAFLWHFLHEPGDFIIGRFNVYIRYPVIPWIGVMAIGYCAGRLFDSRYAAAKRKKVLMVSGYSAIILFLLLRSFNFYGDAAHWSMQESTVFSLLSFMNVTKYPPSLLYILVTLGPALIFLARAERPLNAVTEKISVFGKVPFFYYVLHIYLIHLLAVIGAVALGYNASDMILTTPVGRAAGLKGYGFNLLITYLVWIGLIFILYPCCRWFAQYKRAHQSAKPWLTYV